MYPTGSRDRRDRLTPRTIGSRSVTEAPRYSPTLMGSSASPARVRPDRFDIAVVIAAVAALVVLVRLGMGLTFFSDEWAVIADRAVTPGDLLRPFNEHW